ncbi:MAG TPA: flagellar biosynthetic protein FliO [Nevskiaceae bacterium]|nr:flagellar biosynthetic protein FliO [Nevskiaceae bacterium]
MIVAATTAASAGLGVGEIGKVFVATLVVVAIILGCAWLLRHTGKLTRGTGLRLRVTAARSLGGKNKLMVAEFEGVQLLLGVGQSGINVLHKAPVAKVDARVDNRTPTASDPKRDADGASPSARFATDLRRLKGDPNSFSARFAAALKQNLGLHHR